MMSLFRDSIAMDAARFFGLLVGISALIVSLFVANWTVLAIPALILVVPSLLYGMR
jgi:hypothetical protein